MESPPANHTTSAEGAALDVVEHAALSDLGREREGNEDSFLEASPIFVVADGMGGAQAGEVASQTAIETFEAAVEAGGLPETLVETVESANARVYEMASSDRDRAGMGTTLTAAVVSGGGLTLGHVGDSRAYRFRGDRLEQLTDDHSLVGGMVRMGQLTAAEAEQHPQRSVILRAVGVEPAVEVDSLKHELEDGDVYLLCSDGLSGMLRDPVIEEVLRSRPVLSEAAEMLVALANECGGRDNITVVLFRVGRG
jgi:protein phosphatase